MANPAQQVMLVSSSVARQLPLDYSGGDVDAGLTDGLACNVDGTVVFKDSKGNTVTRTMVAGQDYCWQVTTILNSGTTPGMGIYGLYST